MKKSVRAIFCFWFMVALLAFASGCATIGRPVGQEDVRVPDMRPPVCYHALPLESLFGIKDITGIAVNIPADWMARQGFSKIGKQVIPRTTFPVAINGQWGWFVGDRDNPFKGEVLIPNVAVNNVAPSDVYLMTEKADIFLKIGREKIDWSNPLDFSPKNEIGRKNLIALLSRFSATEDGTIATELSEGNFVNARKMSNILRRAGGAMPTISSALAIPVVWPFYIGNWVGNGVMSEVSLGGSYTASAEDIRGYLKNVPDSEEKTKLMVALDKRSREEIVK